MFVKHSCEIFLLVVIICFCSTAHVVPLPNYHPSGHFGDISQERELEQYTGFNLPSRLVQAARGFNTKLYNGAKATQHIMERIDNATKSIAAASNTNENLPIESAEVEMHSKVEDVIDSTVNKIPIMHIDSNPNESMLKLNEGLIIDNKATEDIVKLNDELNLRPKHFKQIDKSRISLNNGEVYEFNHKNTSWVETGLGAVLSLLGGRGDKPFKIQHQLIESSKQDNASKRYSNTVEESSIITPTPRFQKAFTGLQDARTLILNPKDSTVSNSYPISVSRHTSSSIGSPTMSSLNELTLHNETHHIPLMNTLGYPFHLKKDDTSTTPLIKDDLNHTQVLPFHKAFHMPDIQSVHTGTTPGIMNKETTCYLPDLELQSQHYISHRLIHSLTNCSMLCFKHSESHHFFTFYSDTHDCLCMNTIIGFNYMKNTTSGSRGCLDSSYTTHSTTDSLKQLNIKQLNLFEKNLSHHASPARQLFVNSYDQSNVPHTLSSAHTLLNPVPQQHIEHPYHYPSLKFQESPTFHTNYDRIDSSLPLLNTPHISQRRMGTEQEFNGCLIHHSVYMGHTLRVLHSIITQTDCHSHCLTYPACHYYSLYLLIRRCYLFDSVHSMKHTEHSVSGSRRCIDNDVSFLKPSQFRKMQEETHLHSLNRIGPLLRPPLDEGTYEDSYHMDSRNHPHDDLLNPPKSFFLDNLNERFSYNDPHDHTIQDEHPFINYDHNEISNVYEPEDDMESFASSRPLSDPYPSSYHTASSPSNFPGAKLLHAITDVRFGRLGGSDGFFKQGAQTEGAPSMLNGAVKAFTAFQSVLAAGDTVMKTFPISDLVRTAYQLSNSGILEARHSAGVRGGVQLGAKDKASGATRPPMGVGIPEVSCYPQGMRCCVPRAAAVKYQLDPPKLNGIDTADCRAHYVSQSNQLCVTVLYEKNDCDHSIIATENMIVYRNIMVIPDKTMNNALCECSMMREINGDYHDTHDSNQMIPSSARWEYSRDAMEKSHIARQKFHDTADKLGAAAKTMFLVGDALTAPFADPNKAVISKSANHFIDSIVSLGEDAKKYTSAPLRETSSFINWGSRPFPTWQPKARGSFKRLLLKKSSPFKLNGVFRDQRNLEDVNMSVNHMTETSVNQSYIVQQEEESFVLIPWQCSLWNTLCEKSLEKLLFEDSCLPTKIIKNGCTREDIQITFHWSKDKLPIYQLRVFNPDLFIQPLGLVCDFLLGPHQHESHNQSLCALNQSFPIEQQDNRIETRWPSIPHKGPLLHLIASLLPEKTHTDQETLSVSSSDDRHTETTPTHDVRHSGMPVFEREIIHADITNVQNKVNQSSQYHDIVLQLHTIDFNVSNNYHQMITIMFDILKNQTFPYPNWIGTIVSYQINHLSNLN